MEEFIQGDIVSYDAILDSNCDPLFENMNFFPPSVADIVNKDLDLMYYSAPDVPEKLRALGRRTVKAFGVDRRFVHLEFFRLTKAHKGLGGVGDFVALEVNMRPAGGYTPDMMNYAHSTDVYKIYAHTHEEIMARYGQDMVMQEEMPPVNWATMGRYMYTARLKTYEETMAFIAFVQG